MEIVLLIDGSITTSLCLRVFRRGPLGSGHGLQEEAKSFKANHILCTYERQDSGRLRTNSTRQNFKIHFSNNRATTSMIILMMTKDPSKLIHVQWHKIFQSSCQSIIPSNNNKEKQTETVSPNWKPAEWTQTTENLTWLGMQGALNNHPSIGHMTWHCHILLTPLEQNRANLPTITVFYHSFIPTSDLTNSKTN